MSTGQPITDAWRGLATHAEGCARCAVAVHRLAMVPEDPGRADGAAHEELCEDGRAAFTVWWEAKHELLDATTALRRRQFILRDQLWDDGVAFEVRAAAIMSMPGPDFRAWLELPEDRRHAQLRALESARADSSERTVVIERAVRPESTDVGERPRRSGWAARQRPGGARRLESTE